MRDNQDSNNMGIIYCSKCGKKNSIHSKFCVNCGNSLRSIEDSIKDTTKNIKEAITNNETYKSFTKPNYGSEYKADFDNNEMVNFVQKKAEYYIPKFKEIQELYKSTSWNWAAFFFNSWWFLYRKMYGYGFGIIVASMIISAVIPPLSLIFSIGIAILSGLYGNVVYLKHIQKELISLSSFEEDLKQRLIISRGGVNVVVPVVLVIISIIIALILGALGTFLYMFNDFYYYY